MVLSLHRHLLLLIFVVFHQYTIADVYLHVPRGSNNRLLGERVNRQNARRVFDSQNNAKGGYNAPEKTQKKSSSDWFHMNYYMSGPEEGQTVLPIEWTNQHGCGHGDLNCNIVLQYMCQATTITEKHRVMRNGNNKDLRPVYGKAKRFSYRTKDRILKRHAGFDRALNEPWEWYDKCARRERNKGLFTANQKLKGDDARFTRQNPQGTRYGYECPEERDYYPYWHPTDWNDIAVLANNMDECSYYKEESFNTKPKGECLELYQKTRRNPETRWRHASEHNNPSACETNGGKWVEFHNFLEIANKTKNECKDKSLIWAIPYRSEDIDQLQDEDPENWKKCLVKLAKPDCKVAPRSRTNHLGNGKGIVPLTYNWVLPHFPSGQEQRCVLRIRYNISTNDYDPNNTFASSNNNNDVISEDPDVKVGKGNNNKVPLQLAINTAQFGRTFQDRSHIFKIIPRKDHFSDCVIHNLNVRGKRGNIVQTFPAVEYDFTPKDLEVKSSHCIHIQFAGSNRNPKNRAGEGRDQTDRNNLVAMKRPDISYPLEDTTGTLFDGATVVDAPNPEDYAKTTNGADIAIAMATAGYFKRAQDVPNPFQVPGCTNQQAEQLDCYPPSYTGLLVKLKPGQYYYMCSRNNNFTNRNQKASIKVTQG